MKIAYLLDTYPSSTETFIAREIEALRRRGFDIEVFALNAGEGARSFHLPARWRKQLPGGAARYFQAAGVAWWRQNENNQFDHIHAGWASYPALMAMGAVQEAGLPWSFSGHARDLFVDGSHWPKKLQSARFAACCTRAGQRFLQKFAPAQAHRVLYIPHGLELDKFEFREPDVPEKALRVFSVGRLVEKKGFDVLLQAMAILRDREYSYQLTIIGEGKLRSSLEKQRDNLGLQNYVSLPGAQPLDRVLQSMCEADLFALPCRVARDGDRDGIPNVLLEAAACGLPIVAARAGGVSEFVAVTTGQLCQPDDATELANSLAAVWSEPDATLQRCRAARARVESDFDIEKNIEVLARAFRGDAA